MNTSKSPFKGFAGAKRRRRPIFRRTIEGVRRKIEMLFERINKGKFTIYNKRLKIMESLRSVLPPEVIDNINHQLNPIYLNITTEEYIENFTEKDYKLLLKKKKKDTTEFKQDLGESHWKRTDKIVVVPPHLYKFVRYRYCKLTL